MITIVNYNVGNIGSVVNMFKRIGVKAVLSSHKDDIKYAEKLFLPGVGSFAHGMKCLEQSGLIRTIEEQVFVYNKPVLGVCLGMQLMFEHSEEGDCQGLGWIKGKVKKFDQGKMDESLKVPHMGWNVAKLIQENQLTSNFYDESRFYFAHSYHAQCHDGDNILAATRHGYNFPSIVQNGNIYGAQFHPEKSHKFGMRLLENFANLKAGE